LQSFHLVVYWTFVVRVWDMTVRFISQGQPGNSKLCEVARGGQRGLRPLGRQTPRANVAVVHQMSGSRGNFQKNPATACQTLAIFLVPWYCKDVYEIGRV
jgi:hypothetical protein